MENAIFICYNDTWKNVVRITNTVRSFSYETTFVAGIAALILVNLLASCDPNTPADTAEEVSVTTSAVDTEAPTEPVTDAPTETTAEETTEEVTEEVTEGAETHRPTREDWEADDPQNPYYNLIQVGTSLSSTTIRTSSTVSWAMPTTPICTSWM